MSLFYLAAAYFLILKGFTSADGDILVMRVAWISRSVKIFSKDSKLELQSSRGNENAHKTFDLVEVLTHSSIHVIV